jgi:enediyne biosynthesis protein E4
MNLRGGSYLSAHDSRLMLGIGNRQKLDWFEVKWPQPSNAINRLPDLRVNRHITIMEGKDGWKWWPQCTPLLSRQLLAEALWVRSD